MYALGVLLYEMLVAEPPPVGADPSPRLKRADLPVGVVNVIRQAMAPYPEGRFAWAGDLHDALAAALASEGELRATPEVVGGTLHHTTVPAEVEESILKQAEHK